MVFRHCFRVYKRSKNSSFEKSLQKNNFLQILRIFLFLFDTLSSLQHWWDDKSNGFESLNQNQNQNEHHSGICTSPLDQQQNQSQNQSQNQNFDNFEQMQFEQNSCEVQRPSGPERPPQQSLDGRRQRSNTSLENELLERRSSSSQEFENNRQDCRQDRQEHRMLSESESMSDFCFASMFASSIEGQDRPPTRGISERPPSRGNSDVQIQNQIQIQNRPPTRGRAENENDFNVNVNPQTDEFGRPVTRGERRRSQTPTRFEAVEDFLATTKKPTKNNRNSRRKSSKEREQIQNKQNSSNNVLDELNHHLEHSFGHGGREILRNAKQEQRSMRHTFAQGWGFDKNSCGGDFEFEFEFEKNSKNNSNSNSRNRFDFDLNLSSSKTPKRPVTPLQLHSNRSSKSNRNANANANSKTNPDLYRGGVYFPCEHNGRSGNGNGNRRSRTTPREGSNSDQSPRNSYPVARKQTNGAPRGVAQIGKSKMSKSSIYGNKSNVVGPSRFFRN